MDEIVFVTHNKGKIASASRQLEGVNFKVFEYDLEEPRSDDIKYISKSFPTHGNNFTIWF